MITAGPRCEDCGILLDRHGEECGFEIGDARAPEYGRPAGWLNPGTGEFQPVDPWSEDGYVPDTSRGLPAETGNAIGDWARRSTEAGQ
jgi:hypothetical protein